MNPPAHANVWTAVLGGALAAAGCGESSGANPGTGGAPATSGGSSSSSGGLATGSLSATGGAPSSSGGIAPGTGGANTTGGSNTIGGSNTTGGSNTGGAPQATGGTNANTGGGAGAASSIGGNAAGGGSNSGGATGASTSAGGTGGATPSTGCGVTTPLESGRATISVSGATREYVLRIPDAYDANRPYKLIFGFHARGGNANQVTGSGNDNYYGLYSRAGGSAIFVGPEGLDAGWRNTDGRDIAFVTAMLAEFNAKLCIDQQRIFSVGFSFGGMMSDAIGCAMADVFRAIAPIAGAIPNPEHPYSGCDQTNMHPIAVWMAHGDNDTVVPLADGKDALNLFIARNECQDQTMPVDPSPCVAYQGCTAGYPIHFCQFSGGHTTPSFASAAIWTFFNQF